MHSPIGAGLYLMVVGFGGLIQTAMLFVLPEERKEYEYWREKKSAKLPLRYLAAILFRALIVIGVFLFLTGSIWILSIDRGSV